MRVVDYESDRLLDEYLLFHYGEDAVLLPWPEGPRESLRFPVRCVEETFDPGLITAEARALDVGCAVGRSTFELSRRCGHVVGIDFSHRFIETARRLAAGEEVAYRVQETGSLHRAQSARRPDECHPERITFEVGDAHQLRADLGRFDLVLACNLLCRMREPRRLLRSLERFVLPGGQLVLSTPHSRQEYYTPQSEWLVGDDPVHSPLETIRGELEPHFELARQLDLPFLIREHRRKFQWSVAEASIWRRLGAPAIN